MENSKNRKRDLKPYLVGGALLYIALSICGAVELTTAFPQRIGVGLAGGAVLWLITQPIHFLAQVIGRRLMKTIVVLSPRYEMVVLNVPVTALLVLVALWALPDGEEATEAFKRLVSKPIPPSVTVEHYGKMLCIGGDNNFAIEFKISPADMVSIIEKEGYSRENITNGGLEFSAFHDSIKANTGIDFQVNPHYSHVVLRSSGVEKHIFFATNDLKALFWLQPGRRTW